MRDEPRDEPPLVKHLESVRVVPRKGVAFAKFSDAATAMRCTAAIADANGALGALRVKCMLAEPKASAGAGAGAAERANRDSTTTATTRRSSSRRRTGGGGIGRRRRRGVQAQRRTVGRTPGGIRVPQASQTRRRRRRPLRRPLRRRPEQLTGRVSSAAAPNPRPRVGEPTPTSSNLANLADVQRGERRGDRRTGNRTVAGSKPRRVAAADAAGPATGGVPGGGVDGGRAQGRVGLPPANGGGVPTLGQTPHFHPAAGAPPPPPHYPPPAFAHFPAGTAHHPHATVHASAPNATPNFIHHAHVPGVHPRPNAPPPQPPDWPPPSPAASARSGASSALSGGGGGGE